MVLSNSRSRKSAAWHSHMAATRINRTDRVLIKIVPQWWELTVHIAPSQESPHELRRGELLRRTLGHIWECKSEAFSGLVQRPRDRNAKLDWRFTPSRPKTALMRDTSVWKLTHCWTVGRGQPWQERARGQTKTEVPGACRLPVFLARTPQCGENLKACYRCYTHPPSICLNECLKVCKIRANLSSCKNRDFLHFIEKFKRGTKQSSMWFHWKGTGRLTLPSPLFSHHWDLRP